MRDAVAHRLRTAARACSVAGSLADALRAFREARPALLISDLGLPERAASR